MTTDFSLHPRNRFSLCHSMTDDITIPLYGKFEVVVEALVKSKPAGPSNGLQVCAWCTTSTGSVLSTTPYIL